MLSYILAQLFRHSPQQVEQSKPALRQEQRRVSQPIFSYIALLSAALLEQHPCHIAQAAVDPLLLSSRYNVDADVDQALNPPSIRAPGGKHGSYGT